MQPKAARRYRRRSHEQNETGQRRDRGRIHRSTNASAREAEAVFVTYVSPRRLAYVDAAVMLSLSLQRYAPHIARGAVLETGPPSPSNLDLTSVREALYRGGWQHIVAAPSVHPPNAPVSDNHIDACYSKVFVLDPRVLDALQGNLLRRFDRLVFLDADTWVRSPRIVELTAPGVVTSESPLAAAKDVYSSAKDADQSWGSFNTGVMVLRPSFERFREVFEILMSGHNPDQPVINWAYGSRIATLGPVFNYHGTLAADPEETSPQDAVVVHFLGVKPTEADAEQLHGLCRGLPQTPNRLRGGGLFYAEFCAAMGEELAFRHLSADLQRALSLALVSNGPSDL